MGYKEDITKIYVGYYDRAPDPAGLQYWIDRAEAGMTLAEIAQSFSVQSESTAKYPYLATPDVVSAESFIVSIYNNLFNRAPDDAGKAYWLGELAAGKPVGQMIIDIMSGAKDDANGNDLTTLNNKVAVGVDFAEDTALISGLDYENNAAAKAAAAAALNGVDDTDASVTSAKAATDAFVSGGAGSTLSLTKNVDTIVGTANGDTIVADQTVDTVLSAADTINGGDGVDTFKIFNKAATKIDELPLGGVSAVEKLVINNGTFTDAMTLDVSGLLGLTSLTVDTPKALTDNDDVTIKTASTTAVTLKKVDGAAGGNADVVILDGATDVTVDGVANTDKTTVDLKSTATEFKITASGADSEFELTNSGGKMTKLTLAGDKDLKLAATPGFDGTSGEIDGSAATGDLDVTNASGDNVTFKGGSGKNTVVVGGGDDNLTGGAKNDDFTVGGGVDTVDAGDGDDLIKIAGNLTKNDTIDGGAGDKDAIITDDATIGATEKAQAAGVSNVEIFGTTETGAITVDFNALGSFDQVAIVGTAADGRVSATMENGDAIIIDATRAETTNEALLITPELDNGNNVATVKISGGHDLTGEDDGITAANIETLNLEIIGTKKTGTADETVIADADAGENDIVIGTNGTIVLTSSLKDDATVHNNVDLGAVEGTNATIDGSAFKGNIKVATVDGNTTIKGGERRRHAYWWRWKRHHFGQ